MTDEKKSKIEKIIITVLSLCCVICVVLIICNFRYYFPDCGDDTDTAAGNEAEETTEYIPSVITGGTDGTKGTEAESSHDSNSPETSDLSSVSSDSDKNGETASVFEQSTNTTETAAKPVTTSVVTTKTPDTTSKLVTTADVTTKTPDITTNPNTTSAVTTKTPVTTSKPVTTAVVTTKTADTTSRPGTTAAVTTKTPVTPDVTTKSQTPETSVQIPETYYVPEDITVNVDVRDVLIAPNGDEVTGVWRKLGKKTFFVVDVPELEVFVPYYWWGWVQGYNTLVWGKYVKTSGGIVGFQPDVELPPIAGSIVVDSSVRTSRPGTWW